MIGLVLVALIVIAVTSPQFQWFTRFPSHLRVTLGQKQQLQLGLPLGVYVRPDQDGVIGLDGRAVSVGQNYWRLGPGSPVAINALKEGHVSLEFLLFGLVPIKHLAVDVVPEVQVCLGGHSIGVLLHSEGVVVVGIAPVVGEEGQVAYPARDAGLEKGDIIIKVNGRRVGNEDGAVQLIDYFGRVGDPITLEVKRQSAVLERIVKPVLCRETGRYRIGLYIRDVAAGVGTLTFYEPASGAFGALGHVITDAESNRPLSISDGRIVSANVTGVQPGKTGRPGEKIGTFTDESDVIGTIQKNTEFGIYGQLSVKPSTDMGTVSIALMREIRRGPAEILTVVEGQRIERFSVEIERVSPQERPDTKGMVIRVTDQRLLRRTGGIVQGMSGSPIVQNGRLVGAVTHVFVNDPTRGYAVFAEWMLLESGILQSQRAVMEGGGYRLKEATQTRADIGLASRQGAPFGGLFFLAFRRILERGRRNPLTTSEVLLGVNGGKRIERKDQGPAGRRQPGFLRVAQGTH
jgi:stage IV sporulation protein B